MASDGEATLPIRVHLRAVTFVGKDKWPRGVNADEVGSSCRSSQYGHTQSGPICAAARVRMRPTAQGRSWLMSARQPGLCSCRAGVPLISPR